MTHEIWQHIVLGDQNAYSEAYRHYYKKLFNYGRKFTVDETLIEDSIQEILLQLWAKRAHLPFIRSPNTYLLTAFRHTLFKKMKRQRRQPVFMEESNTLSATGHPHVEREEKASLEKELRTAVEQLTPRQREAIYLRFYEELSYDETAAVMNLSVKASYKIVARALLALREKLPVPLLMLVSLMKNVYN